MLRNAIERGGRASEWSSYWRCIASTSERSESANDRFSGRERSERPVVTSDHRAPQARDGSEGLFFIEVFAGEPSGSPFKKFGMNEWTPGVAWPFHHGESRLPPPPRDPAGDSCPRARCSLPCLTDYPRLTPTGRPCRRRDGDRCPRRTRLRRWLAGPVLVGPDEPRIRPPLKTISRVSSGA